MRVLVVDDSADTRDQVAKLISLEPDIEVVGTAGDGAEALELAAALKPDVVLMDMNMPGMDGIAATEQLSRRMPEVAIVMISVQDDVDYLRRSMLAGAREFLVKPFGSEELIASVRAVHERAGFRKPEVVAVGPGRPAEPSPEEGKIVALFSPKGGVGRTTIAVNMAVAAALELRQSVALVDASLQFGDVGLLMNISPKGATIADIIPDVTDGRMDGVDAALIEHTSGVKVLLPPPSPEAAELVSPDHMRTILMHLKRTHDLVIVDGGAQLHEPTLTALDVADIVLSVMTLELTSIKNMRVFLGVAERLGYADGKVRMVLNRSDQIYRISTSDVMRSLGRSVDHVIVNDVRTVVDALNQGVPFFSLSPQAPISRDVARVARALVSDEPESEPAPKTGLFQRRLVALGR